MFASYKVLLNCAKMNAVPLSSNVTLIVETRLSRLIYLYIDCSNDRVIQKRTRVLRYAVARMLKHKKIHPVHLLNMDPSSECSHYKCIKVAMAYYRCIKVAMPYYKCIPGIDCCVLYINSHVNDIVCTVR